MSGSSSLSSTVSPCSLLVVINVPFGLLMSLLCVGGHFQSVCASLASWGNGNLDSKTRMSMAAFEGTYCYEPCSVSLLMQCHPCPQTPRSDCRTSRISKKYWIRYSMALAKLEHVEEGGRHDSFGHGSMARLHRAPQQCRMWYCSRHAGARYHQP